LGTIGTAVYRSGVTDALPPDVPVAAADAARDTLGGALAVAQELPGDLGQGLAGAALDAFAQGLHISATAGAAIAVVVALLVGTLLRDVRGSHHEGLEEVPAGVAADCALCPAIAES
ncbi:MAG: MFS transporter, partial [Actinomycetota bacterium]|nr:MFS transporter [Actinomycetota bacterium]